MLLAVGISFEAFAQAKKKSHKGSKKKPATEATTTAPAATPPPAATPEPVVMDPGVPADDTGVATPDLVASSDSFSFDAITLDSVPPSDGYYKATTLRGARPFPMPHDDKNSIKFYKRIWREIKTTDSENKILAVPGETMMALIMDGIKHGKLVAYADESFKKKLTYPKVMAKFRDSVITPIIDSNGEQTGTRTALSEFNPDSVTKFEIKEDIYFDKVRGRVITKIIGLAPVQSKKNSQGAFVGYVHPFYLYFDQCRKLFASKEVVDPQRDLYNISLDDIFIQRSFKSLIVKESNPADLSIKDKYPEEAKQLREAARIEREIARYKRNLWKY